MGTEPASENRIRSCCGSTPGIRFYCKPVTLVRCREIRVENRFSGLVGGKWLCEMTSAHIIKALRGARALRLFCGRSAFPPPFILNNYSNLIFSFRWVWYFPGRIPGFHQFIPVIRGFHPPVIMLDQHIGVGMPDLPYNKTHTLAVVQAVCNV